MNWRVILICGVFTILPLRGQKNKDATAAVPAAAADGAAAQSEREEKFKETMAGAVLTGRWCLVEEGGLTEEREETYRILSAMKTAGDNWLIRARMRYGGREMVIPVPVKVKWAGDTPVITVDPDPRLGEMGKYSARVVIHQGTYAGTWAGPERKGLLHGIIRKQETLAE